MNKSIMISVNPEHALNILQGKKTLELRKRVPKGFVGWVYMYVTKGKPYLIKHPYHAYMLIDQKGFDNINGTIVARWWHDEYETYTDYSSCTNNENGYECENEYLYQLCELPNKLKELCLTCDEVENYGNGKDLYAWHIKQLEIFDKPMALGEFYVIKTKKISFDTLVGVIYGEDTSLIKLTKAPQSYQFVWVRE